MKSCILKLTIMVICMLSLSSCATMTRWFDSPSKNNEMYTVYIDSKTKGLPVYTHQYGAPLKVGTTPCRIYSDRAKVKYVTVENAGTFQTVKLDRKPRKSSYWNFVPYYTWIWGYFVDQGTGRGKTYGRKTYYVDL